MSWERIRGHAAARQLFQSAAIRGRLGQAYLLVGPDGIGKRLFACELARAFLCERPPATLTACGACPACTQVTAETHPDLLFLRTPEDKHELPVEDMREFCTQLTLKPTRGERKVGIVVDADDFNLDSANSFLKALEEPPPGTILLLIATSTDGQLPTILSRCQVVRFNPLGTGDLLAILAEQGVASREQRERLVKLASGSVSRALALNDEATWGVREELIRGVTSERPDFVQLAGVWWKFVEGAGKETALQRLRASATIGFLIDVLRQCLRMTLGATTSGGEPAEQAKLEAYARRMGTDRLFELVEKCLEADWHVERRVQLILVIESVLHQFVTAARPSR